MRCQMSRFARSRLALALTTFVASVAVAVGAGPAAFSAGGGGAPASGAAEVPFTSGASVGETADRSADTGVSARTDLVEQTEAATRAVAAARREAAPPPAEIAVFTGATVAVRDRPAGRVVLRLAATTEFGGSRRLGVVERRGRWLGVTTADLPNGTLGWIDAEGLGLRVEETRWALRADLSDRTLTLLRDGSAVRQIAVAIGTPSSPTPTGRFAVTDKLDGTAYGPYYGCCVLAVSATQPNLPAGWTGGNRMAIHGTDAPDAIGAAASAGCLRAGDDDLRALMERVPVGAPVVIRD